MPKSNRSGATAGPPPVTGPTLTTSVYDTAVGLAALTWSRALFALSLTIDLHLDGPEAPLRLRVKPWLFLKRRGSKRFHLKAHRRTVDVAWDLAAARFPSAAAPEPSSGYYVTVSVDGHVVLVAGDLVDEAFRRSKATPFSPGRPPALLSRREHVVLGDAAARRSYRTCAQFGGREREISIVVGVRGGGDKDRDGGMSVLVDGERVLHVRRLRWKFRGNEKASLAGGERIRVSWDLHDWLFQSGAGAAASPELGHAVFVLRFEGEEERKEGEGHFGKEILGDLKQGVLGGHFGKNKLELSDSRSLRKTSSSSSSNSVASSGSSLTVMDWASEQEIDLCKSDGFSLLVYAWKNKF